ncbi:FGGY-family carbohydrate kinase [Roseateles sp.]|uniref:FGGY-family carbohydrate kinase n=1 Tax=Roseateles sp. TaxID=1971397 RepID=UPI00395F6E15
MQDLLLALDLGTQSVRALLFAPDGRLVARRQQLLNDYQRPQAGWMTHDGEAFWQASAACIRALWTGPDAQTAGRVAGLAVTTQRGSMLPVGAQGAPLAPAIIWPDERVATQLPHVAPWWRAAFHVIGMRHTLERFQRAAELNWWAEHEPALHAKAHKFLLLSGLLHQRLTGRFVDSVGAQVAYLPFDYKRHAWCQVWDWPWQALAIRPDQLPDLVPVGQPLGTLSLDAARATGLPQGLPVIASAADKACEVLGAGALQPHIGALSYGTTATLNITSPRYIEAERFVPAYPAAVPGHYSAEVQIQRGFWLVSWFRDQFGHPECAAAEALGVAPESLFDELIAQVPPGCEGLTLLPTWSPGVCTPGPEARGAIIGFGPQHTRAHLYRAILEGLAYALREGRAGIERASGQPLTELRASGGGAQSDGALQLTADVFRLRVGRPHTHETSGLGAAINLAVGLGLHASTQDAVAAMTRVERWFEPQPAAADRYDRLFTEVYRPLYGRVRPVLRALHRLGVGSE